jgi:hypothetical protein
LTWLTKSRFLSGLQCPKRLWLELHEPLDEPLVETINLLNGRAVDELVRRIEPGLVIPWDHGMSHAGRDGASCARSAPPVLHQAAFRSAISRSLSTCCGTGRELHAAGSEASTI